MPSEPVQKVHKPQAGHKPYNRAPKPPISSQPPPKTSAIISQKHTRQNLTLGDWLAIVAYHDNHQPITKEDVIKHFTGKKDGALVFAQSSLSRHLSTKGHEEDRQQLNYNPTALPTLEDLLNPSAEQEIGDSPFCYPHGDADIIKEVKQRLNGAENGLGPDDGSESSDEEGDDKSDAGAEPTLTPSQGMDLCQQLEALCLQYADIDGLEASRLQHHL
ncbi:hypothetical protein PAXRUDRAFT_16465 [Paxillus rubicundulus Ve08.2h10]|uniref:Uncharacterized protein n=1 Tax=Paxillus rubicundulus Ve08.2h10 TaxID=930991 RepID=A0A0D0C8B4_9AGAM|nr:hypothetical protein PAXRUDRAFT_16465 [Paxillus rubicundulus Ve08.2h10]